MARNTAVIATKIWRDESFTALSGGAQTRYLMLLTQRDLDAGAIIPLLMRRWAGMSAGETVGHVETELAELTAAGWVYADYQVQELFVSGCFESEHIHKQPRRAVAAREAISRSGSPRLQAVALGELETLAAGFEPRAPRGIRAVVLERDGYRCRACGWTPGDPVPLKAGTSRPVFRGLEVDHIWPRSKGGVDAEGNFQALCTTCNCKKGARTDVGEFSLARSLCHGLALTTVSTTTRRCSRSWSTTTARLRSACGRSA
jgi:hypothetical protein